jgi:quinolinate synthase|tara:strand:- start:291 stop:1211 length:921 start_codon:yes stop_codon:yes gene_type:complete
LSDIFTEIDKLKRERNAVIMAHYYQDPDIQDVADFVGDSLALAQHAKKIEEDVILFCGVHFMCETAKIMNPEKRVIFPDKNAGCSLAESAPASVVEKWVNNHPQYTVISYINCSAEVKALSDIICTSSNAEKIINSLPIDEKILFLPDRFLGSFLNSKTNRHMRLWNGSCHVHEMFSAREVVQLKSQYPDALVLAHPECSIEVLVHADHIGSTTSIINYSMESKAQTFIIATEPGVIHQMKKQNNGKTYIPLPANNGCSCNECPHMRLNTLEKMVFALENMAPEINLNKDLRLKALKPLERMLALS